MRLLVIVAILLVSCGKPSLVVDEVMIINKDTFDLIITRSAVKSCDRIQISVVDDMNPRYRIVTTDSMTFKSNRAFSVGDSIDVNVYKRRTNEVNR